MSTTFGLSNFHDRCFEFGEKSPKGGEVKKCKSLGEWGLLSSLSLRVHTPPLHLNGSTRAREGLRRPFPPGYQRLLPKHTLKTRPTSLPVALLEWDTPPFTRPRFPCLVHLRFYHHVAPCPDCPSYSPTPFPIISRGVLR